MTAFWLTTTYLIYTIIWDCGIVAGTSYIVFWLGHSGWWFVPAMVICGSCYKPWHWKAILTGEAPVTESKGGQS